MDGIDNLLKELVEFISTASPVVWEILMKQVYVEMIGNFLWFFGLSALGVISYKVGVYGKNRAEDDYYSSWELGMWLFWILAVTCGVVAFGLLVSGIMMAINPEFYAIKFIIQQIQ